MRRVPHDPAAVYTWLLVTLAAAGTALVADRAVLAIIGYALGGVAAFVLVAIKARRGR